MLVIKNKILPLGKKFFAINLFGIVFVKGECCNEVLNHEKIHSRQMIELLVLPFYLFYFLEWIIRLMQYRTNYEAYLHISFEREAYENQKKLKYLEKRKKFNFVHYIIN